MLEQDPSARVLILSASGEQDDVLEAVKAGATGYLVKSAQSRELVDAVRGVAAGGTVFTPGLAGLVLGEFRRMADPASQAAPGTPELTERETEVLKMVAKGMSYKQIAERLVISHRTVQNHVQNTLRKLQMHNRVELTRYAIEQGLDDDERVSRWPGWSPRTSPSWGTPTARRPTLESLAELHRRHLARVPYENLEIMLGRPPSVDPLDSLARVASVGRAGYCFHQNGALETALVDLGYAVSRRGGHVWTTEDDRWSGSLNHLVLVVSGLPTEANPGGAWWPDVGLGDAIAEPLPLVVGDYEQGGFSYAITEVRDDGWSFRADRQGSFLGLETGPAPSQTDVAQCHATLSTPPDGRFARILVVQRRMPEHVDVVRGCLCQRVTPDGQTEQRADDVRRVARRDLRRLRTVAGRGR